MKRLALLALPISFVFCLSLAVEDSFSRGGGGGRGGGFGGGWRRRRCLSRRRCFSEPFHEFIFPVPARHVTV